MQNVSGPAAACLGDRYTKVPNVLHLLAEAPREFQLVAALLSYRWTPASPIIPSVDTLARQLGCSHRTIRRTVARLETRGLLQRVARHVQAERRQVSNEYRLCGALLACVTRMDVQRVQGGGHAGDAGRSLLAGERFQRNQTQKTTKSQPGSGAPGGTERYTGGALARYVRT